MRADCLVACLPMKEENTVPLPSDEQPQHLLKGEGFLSL